MASAGANLFALDLKSGRKRLLATLPPGTTFFSMGPSPFSWSQDAGKLGFVRTVLCDVPRGHDSLSMATIKTLPGGLLLSRP